MDYLPSPIGDILVVRKKFTFGIRVVRPEFGDDLRNEETGRGRIRRHRFRLFRGDIFHSSLVPIQPAPRGYQLRCAYSSPWPMISNGRNLVLPPKQQFANYQTGLDRAEAN